MYITRITLATRLIREEGDRLVRLVPLAIASLLTGLIQSLGTRWGLFRRYWVVVKQGPRSWRTTDLHALGASSGLPSKAAVRRLVTVTLDGLRAS